MLPVPNHYLLLLALCACLSSLHKCQCYVPLPKIDLQDKSYMLEMLLRVGRDELYTIQEMHSAWQARSKILYRAAGRVQQNQPPGGGDQTKSSPLMGTIYADKERLLKVNNLMEPPSCMKTDHGQVDELFKQNALKGLNSGHLIGASRLLSFAQANSDKFSQITPSSEQDKGSPVYKLMFEAEFNHGTEESEFTITLFYHELAAQNLPNGIPRMMSVKTRSQVATTIYTFNQYQALKEGQIQASTSSVEAVDQYRYSKDDELTYDMFAVDPSLGCTKEFIKEQRVNPRLVKSRFSFTAKPAMNEPHEPLQMSVVHEPRLDHLRIDQVYESKSVNKLLNFFANHQYLIIRKHSNAVDPELDRVFRPEKDHSCVVSKISMASFGSCPYSMGYMLLGTQYLAYMGLARVRGIEARVYESPDCDWPVWLQQPTGYMDSSGKNQNFSTPATRRDKQVMKKRGITMSSSFYFAKTDNEDVNDLRESKLLLVEILLKDDKRAGAIIRKHSYSIFDFDWGLPNSSPARGGGRYEDSFSLQNDCLADVENGEYSTINLLLEAQAEAKHLAWLQDRTRRHLALLEMLQKRIHLEPISMVYDLESRMTTGIATSVPGGREPLHPVSLAITMKTARRNERVVSLVLVGLLYVNSDYMDTVKLDNFQLCYTLAAHQRADTIFAFRPDTFECSLIKPGVLSRFNGDVTGLMEEMSRFQAHGRPRDAELYQIQHSDKTIRFTMNVLKTAKVVLNNLNDLNIDDPAERNAETESNSNAPSESNINLAVKSVNLIRLDESNEFDIGDIHLSETNKYLGFGLVAEDEQNKLAELKGADDDDQNEMSFEHCQTACLADFECRSFSVCYNQGVWRCILSKISFRPTSMVRQLMELTDKEAKNGKKYSITVDLEEQNYLRTIGTKGASSVSSSCSSKSATIHLLKHQTCELHNKLYHDLFKSYDIEPITIALHKDSIIWPVAHIEHCSEICFSTTLKFLRAELDHFAELQAQAFSSKSQSTTSYNKACDVFHYISHETIDQLEPESAALFKKSLDDSYRPEKVGGYCLSEKNAKLVSVDERDSETIGPVTSQRYEFNYLTLYTKQSGKSMIISPVPDKAHAAVWSSRAVADPGVLAELKPDENYGSNTYIHISASNHAAYCAKDCLFPSYRMAYPSCQSFDSFVINNPKKLSQTACGYNSLTLAAARAANRTDLIRIGSDKQERLKVGPMDTVSVWHYELRPGLVADSVEAMYKIQLAGEMRAARASASLVHIGGFGLFCCLFLMLSLGIAIGITLNSRSLAKSQKIHEDTDELVDDRINVSESVTKVEFNTLDGSNGA